MRNDHSAVAENQKSGVAVRRNGQREGSERDI